MKVKINEEKLAEYAKNLLYEKIEFCKWDGEQFIQSSNLEEIAQSFFIGNAINFKFWFTNSNDRYAYKNYSGSAAMWKFLKDNPKLLDASFLVNISKEDIPGIMEMPFGCIRINILREVGCIMECEYQGKIINLCNRADWDAEEIVGLIIKSFPMWRDEQCGYCFNKRAQLFVAMLHGKLGENSKIINIDKLTFLADYQVPKVFRFHGILEYADELAQAIDNGEIILDLRDEYEIRYNTILVGNKLVEYLKKQGKDVVPIQLDYIIWKNSHDIVAPHHLTITTAY